MSLILLDSLQCLPRYQLELFAHSSRGCREFVDEHSAVLPLRQLKLRVRMDAIARLTDLSAFSPNHVPQRRTTLFDVNRPELARLRNCRVTTLDVRGNDGATPNQILMRMLRLLQLKWSWSGATVQLLDLPPPSVIPAAQFLALFDNCGLLVANIPRGPVPSLSTYLHVFGAANLARFGTITIDALDDQQADEEGKAGLLLEALLTPTKSPRVGRHVVMRNGSYTAARLIEKFGARALSDNRRFRANHSITVQSRLSRWTLTPYACNAVSALAVFPGVANPRTGAFVTGSSTDAQVHLEIVPTAADSLLPIDPADRPYYQL